MTPAELHFKEMRSDPCYQSLSQLMVQREEDDDLIFKRHENFKTVEYFLKKV